MKLIVEQADWTPPAPRYESDDLVPLRMDVSNMPLRERVKAASGRWFPEELLWYVKYGVIVGGPLEKHIYVDDKCRLLNNELARNGKNETSMRTKKAKAEFTKRTGDMRRFMALGKLYDVCLANAEALLSEASLLFDHGHFARAYALAYTGWEEVGKAQLTADFAYEMVSDDEFEAAYSDHKIKSAYNWRQFVLNAEDIENSTIEYDRKKANEYFAARQKALYVNKTSSFQAISPQESISEETAKSVIQALSKELKDIRFYDFINERMGSKSFLK